MTITKTFEKQYEQLVEETESDSRIGEKEQGESGYSFENIIKITTTISRYHAIQARSYCKLLKPYCDSKSVVNIQNDDNCCFLWCILAHSHEVDRDRERVSHIEKYFTELNQSDLQIPMKLKHIPKFEKLERIIINVFGLTSSGDIFRPYVSKNNYKN